MPGNTSTALPCFSHDQHHKTDAAKWKVGWERERERERQTTKPAKLSEEKPCWSGMHIFHRWCCHWSNPCVLRNSQWPHEHSSDLHRHCPHLRLSSAVDRMPDIEKHANQYNCQVQWWSQRFKNYFFCTSQSSAATEYRQGRHIWISPFLQCQDSSDVVYQK